jgi:hypothetical protein
LQKEKNVNHNFKQEIKLAGKEGAQGFLTRNRELRVRKREPITVVKEDEMDRACNTNGGDEECI